MTSKTATVFITPIAKPRQMQSDKWRKRPAVLRYRAFADELRAKLGPIPKDPVEVSWSAYFPMPPSWSKKKRAAMAGQPHRQKPDRDNVDKAILDALLPDDSGVARGVTQKWWDDGKGPRLIIWMYSEEPIPAPVKPVAASEAPNTPADPKKTRKPRSGQISQ